MEAASVPNEIHVAEDPMVVLDAFQATWERTMPLAVQMARRVAPSDISAMIIRMGVLHSIEPSTRIPW